MTIEGRLLTSGTARARLAVDAAALADRLRQLDPTSSSLPALRTLQLQLGGATPARLEQDARQQITLARGESCDCNLDYADLLIGARLAGTAEQYLRDRRARAAQPPAGGWAYRRAELTTLLRDGPAIALRDPRTLGGFRNNILLLALVLPLLEEIGDAPNAERYEALLLQHDRDGYWANLGLLQRAAVRARSPGAAAAGGPSPPAASARAAQPADELVRGILHFMHGDVSAGVAQWQHLDGRMLQHLAWYLPIHELSFPPQVLAHPSYQSLLEQLGIGRAWTRHMRARALELAPITGIST